LTEEELFLQLRDSNFIHAPRSQDGVIKISVKSISTDVPINILLAEDEKVS
jgi:hypothetical protein